jgi:APA family basic amino acid/polyamine antiporter
MAGKSTRALGLWMCTALVVGNMIGSGVFMLPASLAPYSVNGLGGWAFTVAGAMMLALVFAALSRVVPGAGGPYVYPRAAFGEGVGFLVAWAYWVGTWVGNAAVAIGTTAYLAELVPAIKATPSGPALVTTAMIWLLTYVNWRGTRTMGAVQMVTTILKLMPLLAVGALGLYLLGSGQTDAIRAEPQPVTLDAMTATAILALWGLLGLETATVPADKVDNPARTIPLATIWGTLVTGLIYIVACMTVVMLLPREVAASSSAPFAEVVRQHWGAGAATLLALFAFISGFGALNGWILVQGGMPRVLAEDGIFPRLFARQSRHGTPGSALVITSALVSAMVLMNYSASMVKVFTFIVLISTSANLIMYLAVSLSALRLALAGRMPQGSSGRQIALLVVAALASGYALWTLYGAGAEAFLWCLALVALGIPVYALMKGRRAST